MYFSKRDALSKYTNTYYLINRYCMEILGKKVQHSDIHNVHGRFGDTNLKNTVAGIDR